MLPLRRTALALLVVLGLSACTDPPEDPDAAVEELRAELADRAATQTELAERVEELEVQLERVASDRSTSQRLTDLDEQVSALSETVAGMDERFTNAAEARDAVAEEAAAAAGDLRSTLADLQGRLDQLEGVTDELRTLYESLRERVDRMQQG